MSDTQEFQRVGLVAKRTSPEALRAAAEVAEWLARRGLRVDCDEAIAGTGAVDPEAIFDPADDYDLAVVLGGDGTLLSVARSLERQVPILGVNLGTLGFLTEVGRAELYPALLDLLAGDYSVEERALLNVRLERAGGGGRSWRVLNDAVITKSALARMINIALTVDGEEVAVYTSDGLIVSTPTGSTAYSLSGGGPIMHPALDVVVLVPMFPHALSSRPIVVDGDSEIRLDILARNRIHPRVTCDGQADMKARPGDSVHVSKNPHRLTLLHPPGHDFYAGCRDKLRWSNALVT